MTRASRLCCFKERIVLSVEEQSPSLESRKPNNKTRRSDFRTSRSEKTVLSRKENLSGGNGYREQPKAAEAVFSDNFAGGSIEDINEHVFSG